jgi:hypothetical protein
MRNIVALCSAAALLALPLFSFAQDRDHPTNLELIEEALVSAVDSMDVPRSDPGAETLDLRVEAGGDADWLLDSVLKKRLIALGWEIKVGKAHGDTVVPGNTDFLLSVRVVDLGIKYGPVWRRFMFGGKKVNRLARASLLYELINKNSGAVVLSGDARSEASDVVPASMLSVLSDPKYSFASPELEKTQWDRYLEGGLVLAIVGVLVYLFYSNKTAS